MIVTRLGNKYQIQKFKIIQKWTFYGKAENLFCDYALRKTGHA